MKNKNRKNLRLAGYDYRQAGAYFVTVCCQGNARLLGDIRDGIFHSNPAGKMVEKWYFKLMEKFPNVRCGEWIVMPNHFHCIIEIIDPAISLQTKIITPHVRVDPCVDPSPPNNTSLPTHVRVDPSVDPPPPNAISAPIYDYQNRPLTQGQGDHTGSPLLGEMVRWFKTMTTNEYIRGVKEHNWPRFNRRLWQRNYWDHIIRGHLAYARIAEYIERNPANWRKNDFYQQ